MVVDDTYLGFSSLMEMINLSVFKVIFVSTECGFRKAVEIEET